MNECARDTFIAADAEQIGSVSVSFTNTKTMLYSLGLAFRDAELEALYPHAVDDALAHYGSVWPLCLNLALEELTRRRIVELRRWLEGVEEGDVCAGSVRRATMTAVVAAAARRCSLVPPPAAPHQEPEFGRHIL